MKLVNYHMSSKVFFQAIEEKKKEATVLHIFSVAIRNSEPHH